MDFMHFIPSSLKVSVWILFLDGSGFLIFLLFFSSFPILFSSAPDTFLSLSPAISILAQIVLSKYRDSRR